jgi:hypothetical protein
MNIIKNELLRPKAVYPTYPAYNVGGYYLEEYFYKRWMEDSPQTERKYIDVFWTNLFCNNRFGGQPYPDVQGELNNLDRGQKYFTIVHNDDGVLESLPPDTLVFDAGGLNRRYQSIAIPLICSKIPEHMIPKKEKTIFASFVGSPTHRVRVNMYNHCHAIDGYKIYMSNWDVNISDSAMNLFLDVVASSKFSLAPRGNGRGSFRCYEIMQLNSVPVIISDDHYLPWSDELNWSEFSVLIDENEIPYMDEILKNISDSQYQKMLEVGKEVYDKYFSLEGMYQNIIKRISK